MKTERESIGITKIQIGKGLLDGEMKVEEGLIKRKGMLKRL